MILEVGARRSAPELCSNKKKGPWAALARRLSQYLPPSGGGSPGSICPETTYFSQSKSALDEKTNIKELETIILKLITTKKEENKR